MRTVTVLVDSREKKTLRFPPLLTIRRAGWGPKGVSREEIETIAVATKSVKLPFADYTLEAFCLEGAEHLAAFERKGSISELYSNTSTGDRERFLKAIERFTQGVTVPYLLMDFPPNNVWNEILPSVHNANLPKITGPEVLDRILDLTTQAGLRLIWVSQGQSVAARTRLGELVLRILLSHQEHSKC